MSATRRTLSTILVLAMLMAMTAVPAFAAAIATSSILDGNLLSGQAGSFTVRISNAGATGGGFPIPLGPLGGTADTSIDTIQIEVPDAVYDAQSVTLPTGWTGEYDAEVGFVVATAADGSELAPGSAMDVTINGTADRIADDTTRAVNVFVSDDGGRTLTPAGSPQLTSRILEIITTDIRKPAGATNANPLQVTEGQTTAKVAVVVTNHGTEGRNVTVDAVRTAGSSSVDVTEAVLSVPSGGTRGRAMDAVFGNAGSLSIEGLATTTNSSAALPREYTDIAVQQAFDATEVVDGLSPTSAVQGRSYPLSVDVSKVGAQPADVMATFSLLETTFTATTSTAFAAGSVSDTISFGNVTFPATAANGDYDTEVTLVGTDHNGALIDDLVAPGTISLDNLLPYVALTANVGPSAVSGATPAAGNGRSISFGGQVTVGGNAVGEGDPCGTCTVESSSIEAMDINGNVLESLPITITNTAGTLSGNASVTFPTGTTQAVGRVTVAKQSGLDGTADTLAFPVDIVAPTLASAVTGRDDDGDFITVTMTELVDTTGSIIFDWSVDNNAVSEVIAAPNANGATTVQLRLSQPLGDNDTPSVSYSPLALLSSRYNDRVELTLRDAVIEAIDGIVPEAPLFLSIGTDLNPDASLQQSVDGQVDVDDENTLYTNTLDPTVTLAGLDVNNTIEIFFNGTRVAAGAIAGEEDTFQLSNLGGVDRTGTLTARMLDATGAGELASVTLVIDRVVPTIQSIQVSPDELSVTVTFSEGLRGGRDAAFDWTVLATQNGEMASRTVQSVSAPSANTRVLSVSPASFNPDNGDITGVRFKFRGTDAERYDDTATNELRDAVAN